MIESRNRENRNRGSVKMTERTQISTTIDRDIKEMLQRMCRADLLTFRKQLEHLIRQEHNRRNAPANTLIDERVQYVTKEPA